MKVHFFIMKEISSDVDVLELWAQFEVSSMESNFLCLISGLYASKE